MTDTARGFEQLSPERQALAAVRKLRLRLEEIERQRTEPLAVVGMACRFPGASDVDAFWSLLRSGASAIREVPADRWDINQYYDANPDAPGKMNTRSAGFLDRIDQFEPQFFGISPREAVAMDPQQRLLLEVAWEALEHAGQAPDALMGSRTGVFVGITAHDYAERQLKRADEAPPDVYYGTGNALSCAVGRLSYVLGLVGPNITVDTACSASLVSLHLACQSLRNAECRLALVGGVNLILSPDVSVNLCRARMLAPDGRCKTFDAAADGYVRGEGCGMVVLKRLSDAVADGDRILALVRGTAVNQDGRSSGFTAPNELSQQTLIRDALANGRVEPHRVSYIEAHGTGTPLGDPIEIQALGAVLCANRSTPLTVGSVKTNIGHLESAAGIAGLIKVILSLQHREIPAHLHFTRLNPHIEASGVPIAIPTTLTPWTVADGTRIAGVSSFGFSGTNAHAIVEEAPAIAPDGASAGTPPAERPVYVLPLSARNDAAVSALAERYAQHLATMDEAALADACYTASAGRSHFDVRVAAVGRTAQELREALERAGSVEREGSSRPMEREGFSRAFTGRALPAPGPDVAFLFTGQGSQYAGMARQLYASAPVFRKALDRCQETLGASLDRPLIDLLYAVDATDAALDQTAVTQPALFAVEYALAELWRSWGVQPAVLLGHSLGEYVAACVAGVFSLEDALKLVTARGRLMQSLPPTGAMAAVSVDAAAVADLVAAKAPSLAIAAINGPQDTVVSGAAGDVEIVFGLVTAQGAEAKRLAVSHAFHSPALDPMLDEFERVASEVRYSPPRIAIISNVTGRLADPDEITTPGYWRRHARSTVQFAAGIRAAWDQGCRVFLEIGPSPTLVGLGRRTLADVPGAADAAWVPSLRKGRDDWQQLMEAVANLYIRGVALQWQAVAGPGRRKATLPTYPFRRERYWIEEPRAARRNQVTAAGHPLLGGRLHAAVPTFESSLMPSTLPVLGSHRVNGRAVVPAAAYLEMAAAAAGELIGPGPHAIDDLVILQALTLDDDAPRTVQCVASAVSAGETTFQVFSADESSPTPSWTLHARGTIRSANAVERSAEAFALQDRGGARRLQPSDPGARRLEPSDRERPPLDALCERCNRPLTPATLYASLAERGITIDAAHQAIEQMWTAPGEALAHVRVEPEPQAASLVGPSLLDACTLTLGAVVPAAMANAGTGTFLFSSVAHVMMHGAPTGKIWAHAALRSTPAPSADAVTVDLTLYDDRGTPIAELTGVELKRARLDIAAPAPADWWYDVEWQPKTWPSRGGAPDFLPAPDAVSAAVRRDAAAVFARNGFDDHQRIAPLIRRLAGAYVCDAFRARGFEFAVGTTTGVDELFGRLRIAARHRGLFARLIEMLVEDGVLSRSGPSVTVLRAPEPHDVRADAAQLRDRFPSFASQLTLTARCGEQLAAVLAGDCNPLDLLFPGGDFGATEEVYKDLPLARAFNALLGQTVSTLAAQLPPGRTLRVLEIGAGTGSSTASALPALPADRTEYVFTDVSKLFLARAERTFSAYPFLRGQILDIEADPIAQGFAPHTFDVVIAANVLHATADLARTFAHVSTLLAPGGVLVLMEATSPQRWIDLTFGLTEGWWRFTDRALRPDHPLLSRATWASFLGAHGFDAVSMIPGTSDSSDVPEQTIVIARSPSKVERAAAGPPRQWAIVSGDGAMAAALSAAVAARGDRVVPASAASGERVEIVYVAGARDSGDGAADCASILRTITSVAGNRAGGARLWLATTGAQPVQAAAVVPEQAPVWGLGRVVALEHPALWGGLIDLDPQRDAAGRAADLLAIVDGATSDQDDDQMAVRGDRLFVPRIVSTPSPRHDSVRIDPAGIYVVTGGLGRLGLKVARWLADRGAKHVALVGRHGLPERSEWPRLAAGETDGARQVQAIDEIERAGASVIVAAADAADRDGMRAAFERIAAVAPVKGIVHAATHLSAAPTIEMDEETLRAMLRPKVAGTRVLHEVSQAHALDFFVMFSSTTALWGVAGLAHYAAANTFLDSFASYRRARGLKATTINWGTWDEVRSTSVEDRQRFVEIGLNPMDSARALDALGRAIAADVSARTVASVDWARFKPVYEAKRRRPFLDRVSSSAAASKPTPKPAGVGAVGPVSTVNIVQKLRDAKPSDRVDLLTAHVQSEVARVMGVGANTAIDPSQGLFEMGMDSLMSVELRGRLEASLDRKLPSTLTFNYPSIAALVAYLLGDIDAGNAKPAQAAKISKAAESEPVAASDCANASEDALARMLADRLQKIR